MTSDMDKRLDEVLIGGRERRPIMIVDYDPAWSAQFEEQAGLVQRALGPTARVEHIGSTAVPGLAAKPIIDMLLIVNDIDAESQYLPALVDAGLTLRVREPGHRMLRSAERDVHLHIYGNDAPEIQDYRDLRDWLRHDQADRELYASTKRELAAREWSDANYYAQAKEDIVASTLTHARQWRERNEAR